MTIPNLAQGAISKGIDLIGTGDATQPDWLKHIEKTLQEKDGILTYDGISFIPTVEIEDTDAIHHVVLLPDFGSVKKLRKLIGSASPNLDHEWGGRPRVNLKTEEIAGLVRDSGGLIGPAHAFTPFRAIFREGKYDSIKACYGSEAKHIHFLELGLSADSEVADHIPELRNLSYITCSDAHSPSPAKLGREFMKLKMKSPLFSEIRKALMRDGGRHPTMNLGFAPQLGKYFLSFCSKCRRTLVLKEGDQAPKFDDLNICIHVKNESERERLFSDIGQQAVKCPHDGKPMRLGVRDRAKMLGEVKSKPPSHRPPYLHMPPLLDMIQSALGLKSNKAKSAQKLYQSILQQHGNETIVLTETPIKDLTKSHNDIGRLIGMYRDGKVDYVPGGGGRYGEIINPL
jgi:PHP family Zn ribbon phosphoesterase